MSDAIAHKGSCLCGAVRFEVAGDLPGADACHCTMCRRVSGHYTSGTDVNRDALTVMGDEHITWYVSSERARQGFCSICGGKLFFDPTTGTDWIGINLGAFDTPAGTRVTEHIFVANKGDYYDIADGVPQYQAYPGHVPDQKGD